MMRVTKLVLVLWLLAKFAGAQLVDTVSVATYNLLYYGAVTSFCTTGNNNLQTKNGHLRTIMAHVKPDILGVQEMSSNVGTTLTFLNDVLNQGGVTHYSRANFMNTTSSNILSILYFNNQKFEMAEQQPIPTSLRDIMFYRLYYKEIPPAGDTIFLNVAVMHLKAGSTAADVVQRGQETQALMTFLNTRGLRENIVVMGDLNSNSSSEAGYANMTTHPNLDIRLYDPVNRPGTWFNSSLYADLHTQSPRVSGDGCKSGGGLDDRYDQILINEFVRSDSARVRYLPGSHQVVGNDGQRFNGNLNAPFNASAPVAVINALYEASDHLPVVIKLRVNAGFGVAVPELEVPATPWRLAYQEGQLGYWGDAAQSGMYRWQLRNMAGQLLEQGALALDAGAFSGRLTISNLASGVYWMAVETPSGQVLFSRFAK